MNHISLLFLCLLMLPLSLQSWNIPGSATLMNLYSRVSPLISATTKSESNKKDPVSIATDPSALIAGSAAICSIGVSNKAMKTQPAIRLLKIISQPRNVRLRNAPGLILSTAVGVATFQVLYLSGMAAHRRVNRP